MDLKNIKPKSDTIKVELYHPGTNEPLAYDDGKQFTVTLYAPHTKEFKASQQINVDKWMKMQEKNSKKKPTMAEWDFLYDNKVPKLSVSKAVELYTELFWMKDQIQEALEDSVDFT